MNYRAFISISDMLQGEDWINSRFEEISSQDLREKIYSTLGSIYVINSSFGFLPGGVSTMLQMAVQGEIEIPIPGIDSISFILGGGQDSGYTDINVRLDIDDNVSLSLENISFALRFQPSLLKPTPHDDTASILEFAEIRTQGSFTIKGFSDIGFDGSNAISLAPCSIGDTGIILIVEDLKIDLSGTSSPQEIIDAGYGPEFRGIYIGLGKMIIPSLSTSDGNPLELTLEKAIIGTGGFSGRVAAEWDVALDDDKKNFADENCGMLCSLFAEFEVALKRVSITFDKNIPTEFLIEGAMKLPYFDSIVDIELNLGEGGQILVGLKGLGEEGLINITKEQLFKLQINAFQFKRTAEETAFTLDGDFEITATDMIPKFGVKGLTIYTPAGSDWSHPQLRIEGGKIDINKSFDFHEFRIDITEIGIENQNLIFSGGIQLLEGIDAGAWVKGLRIPLDPGQAGKLTLEGAGLLVVAPAFEFKGEIEHEEQPPGKSIYRGGLALNVIPLGMGVDCQIMVGKNQKCSFTYLYVLFCSPPPGLPLDPSAVIYLRAIDGLIGINVTPDANNIYDYFPLSERPPKGITNASKWRDQYGAYAIGFGIGLATATERLFYMSGLFVLTFPDLMLLIEGKAFVLENPSLGADPPFHMIMAFDPLAPAALINISVDYELIKGVIEAQGVVEAYYGPDPDDASKTIWYFSLGQVTPYFPADKPISARVLIIYGGTGYLIVKPGLWVMGAKIGYPGVDYDFDVISVNFHALIGGEIGLRWDPEQVKGMLELDGAIGFKIFKKGFNIALFASVTGMAPDWLIDALLRFEISIDLWLKSFEFEGEIPFHWEERTTPPVPDVFDQIKLIHAIENKTWDPLITDTVNIPDPEEVPIVEPDSQAVLSFTFPVHDETGYPFGQNAGTIPDHISGDYTFRAAIPSGGIIMERCQVMNDNYVSGWVKFENPLTWDPIKGGKAPLLYGAWLADADPDGVVGATHLQLFARTPFDFDRSRVLSREETGRMFGREPLLSPADTVAAVAGYKTVLKFDDIKKPYPLRSANFVKHEVPNYPFTGRSKTAETIALNFLSADTGNYAHTSTLKLGHVEVSSTRGFKISEDVYFPHSLRYLEIGGDPKNSNRLLLSFDIPVRKIIIHFMYVAESKKSAPPKVYATYKRSQPIKGPWNYDGFKSVAVTSSLDSDGQIEIQTNQAKKGAQYPANFDLLQLEVFEPIKILSISCEFDKSEEITHKKAMLSSYVDVLMRQRPDPSRVSGSNILKPPGEPGTVSKPGGPFTLSDQSPQTNRYDPLVRPNMEGTVIPGYVYRIKVRTNVTRNNGSAENRADKRCAYFYVKDPPSSLEPYVLRTFPRESGFPCYRAREFYVRFLKNYVHKLFPEGYGNLKWVLSNDLSLNHELGYGGFLDTELKDFFDDTSAIREGWRWGAAPDHTLTREEQIWMDAYNRNCAADKTVNETMALGDDMVWIYSVNPVLLRASFDQVDQNFLEFEENGTAVSETLRPTRWSIRGTALYHERKDVDTDTQGSYLLTKELYPADYILSVWIKPDAAPDIGNINGCAGIWLLEEGGQPYIKISIDFQASRVSLTKKTEDGSWSTLVIKEFGIPADRWSKLQLGVKEKDASSISITLKKADQVIFSETLQGISHNGKIGLFATGDYKGYFDNFELISISRLDRIPSAGGNHSLCLKAGNNELFKFKFQASRYLDFLDQMNSWDRNVWISPNPSAWVENEFNLSTNPQTIAAMTKWNESDVEMRHLIDQLLTDEDHLILDMLTMADVEKTSEASVDATKIKLTDSRYKLDQQFQTICEALGFDLVSRSDKFEIMLSQEGHALFIQCPEPIDWTRIGCEQIKQYASRGILQQTLGKKIIYSSDMTRSVVFIMAGSAYIKFEECRQYSLKTKLDGNIQGYLKWIRPWLDARNEAYEFILNVPKYITD